MDPRDLVTALLLAMQRHGVRVSNGRSRPEDSGGAWAGQRSAHRSWRLRRATGGELRRSMGGSDCRPKLPAQPVKGHMVALAFPEELAMSPTEREEKRVLRHVLRSALVLHHSAQQRTLRCRQHGGTGGLRQVSQRLSREAVAGCAARLIPQFAQAKIAEAWTGLRPGTPDNLPLLAPRRSRVTSPRPGTTATESCWRR